MYCKVTQVQVISEDERYIMSEYETKIFIDNLAAGFKYGRTNYGKCTGKVHITINDTDRHIGYVFRKRENGNLIETWLEFFREKTLVYDYI